MPQGSCTVFCLPVVRHTAPDRLFQLQKASFSALPLTYRPGPSADCILQEIVDAIQASEDGSTAPPEAEVRCDSVGGGLQTEVQESG
jgi:hypothetical protein